MIWLQLKLDITDHVTSDTLRNLPSSLLPCLVIKITKNHSKSFELKKNCRTKRNFKDEQIDRNLCQKVFEKEGVDIKGYRNFSLKLRIQNRYPNVRFIKSSKLNCCELVICETNSENVCHFINPNSSSTETGSDDAEQSGASYVPLAHN